MALHSALHLWSPYSIGDHRNFVRHQMAPKNDNQRCGIVDGLQECRSEMYCKLQQECIKCLQIEMSCVITLDMSHIEVPTMPTRGEGQEMETTETETVRNTKKSMSGRGSMSSHHVAVMSDSEEMADFLNQQTNKNVSGVEQ